MTAVKEQFQTYCETTYERSSVKQMWLLKNSGEVLRVAFEGISEILWSIWRSSLSVQFVIKSNVSDMFQDNC